MGRKIVNNDRIQGVVITCLRQIADERGAVFHVIKRSSETFTSFGEVYLSKVNFSVVKGWKRHNKMTQNFSVPYGKIKLVLYDGRVDSVSFGKINEIVMDANDNYVRVTVPNGIWYSFKCISTNYSLLLNVADMEHDKTEVEVCDITNDFIPYQWI